MDVEKASKVENASGINISETGQGVTKAIVGCFPEDEITKSIPSNAIVTTDSKNNVFYIFSSKGEGTDYKEDTNNTVVANRKPLLRGNVIYTGDGCGNDSVEYTLVVSAEGGNAYITEGEITK